MARSWLDDLNFEAHGCKMFWAVKSYYGTVLKLRYPEPLGVRKE